MLEQLQDSLRRAQSRRDVASAVFNEAIKRAGQGSPESAGRVEAASHEYRQALEAVKKATKQLAEFERYGTLPERSQKASR